MLIRSEEEEKIDWPIEFLPDDEEGDILDIEINRDLDKEESSVERIEGLIEKLKGNN